MRTGRYDGVLARGDVSGRLVADHLVAPVNTDLIPNYSHIFPASLKGQPHDTFDDIILRDPRRAALANLLDLETHPGAEDPHDKPPSSNLIFDPAVAFMYRGGVTAPDNPM